MRSYTKLVTKKKKITKTSLSKVANIGFTLTTLNMLTSKNYAKLTYSLWKSKLLDLQSPELFLPSHHHTVDLLIKCDNTYNRFTKT